MQDFKGSVSEFCDVNATRQPIKAKLTVGACDGLMTDKLPAGIVEEQLASAIGHDASAVNAELARFSL